MFQNATNFNQPLNNWNVTSINSMISMFNGATNFNQNISNWTPNVIGKPIDFDSLSGFQGQTTLQPQWK